MEHRSPNPPVGPLRPGHAGHEVRRPGAAAPTSRPVRRDRSGDRARHRLRRSRVPVHLDAAQHPGQRPRRRRRPRGRRGRPDVGGRLRHPGRRPGRSGHRYARRGRVAGGQQRRRPGRPPPGRAPGRDHPIGRDGPAPAVPAGGRRQPTVRSRPAGHRQVRRRRDGPGCRLHRHPDQRWPGRRRRSGPVRYTISGVLDPRGDLGSFAQGLVFYFPDGHPAGTVNGGAERVALLAADGVDSEKLRADAAARLAAVPATADPGPDPGPGTRPEQARVSTVTQYRRASIADIAVAVQLVGAFVQAFAVLALAVAGLVIANTFVILLTSGPGSWRCCRASGPSAARCSAPWWPRRPCWAGCRRCSASWPHGGSARRPCRSRTVSTSPSSSPPRPSPGPPSSSRWSPVSSSPWWPPWRPLAGPPRWRRSRPCARISAWPSATGVAWSVSCSGCCWSPSGCWGSSPVRRPPERQVCC